MTHPSPEEIEEPDTPTHVAEREELLALTQRTGTSLGKSSTSAADYERFSKLVRSMMLRCTYVNTMPSYR